MRKQNYFRFPRFWGVLVLAIFAGMVMCSSSPSGVERITQSKNKTSIVFIDKSGSISKDSLILQMYQSQLTSIISNTINVNGDKVILSFIYEQTDNKANQYVFTYKPPTERKSTGRGNNKRLEKIRFNQRLRSYNKQFTNQVLLKAFSTPSSRSQTYIVGSIAKMRDLVVQDSSHQYSVYFFSDMIESSSFRNMSFSKGGIQSYSEAERLAKTDFSRISKQFYLKKNCLSLIEEITVIFPAKEMDTNKAFAVIPAYWDYIFRQFGVQRINYL